MLSPVWPDCGTYKLHSLCPFLRIYNYIKMNNEWYRRGSLLLCWYRAISYYNLNCRCASVHAHFFESIYKHSNVHLSERERERERESSALLFSLLLFVLCIRTICNAIVSLLLMLPKRTCTASHSKPVSNCADSQEMPNMEAHIHIYAIWWSNACTAARSERGSECSVSPGPGISVICKIYYMNYNNIIINYIIKVCVYIYIYNYIIIYMHAVHICTWQYYTWGTVECVCAIYFI